ncbi:chemotaxis protein CheW [Polyangium sp. 15x6]|uniref:chemotaxis protein CheA n=1 Tax=Polyangium sp. 15x6 TaxID=3042687 RepID=UPI00249C588A|nr:chemotaxis protein CheW [Polyangium sp. 15x6]MDI3287943.1 chemotaxis protein CheW [Polyangium sp. 15x6]
MSSGFDASEFLAGYLVEAEEHLSASTMNLLAVEASLRKGENNPRAVRELFRSLHTVKGLSAMVGVEPIVDIAHAMETVLRHADRAAGALSAKAVEALLAGLRAIGERVRALSVNAPVAPAPPHLLDALAALEITKNEAPLTVEIDLEPDVLVKLSAAERAQLIQGVEGGRRALRVDFVPSPARAAEGMTITTVRERIGAFAEIVKVVPLSIPVSDAAPGGLAFALLVLTDGRDEELAAAVGATPEHVREVLHPRPEGGADPLGEPSTAEEDVGETEGRRRGIVRVEVARLDDALERLSALVITRFRLARAVDALAAQGVNVGELGDIVKSYGRQVRDLRGAIMRARMVPVAELLDRVPLIVRGLSRATNKPVRVVIDAGKAELDKAVAERIFPAIVHLIRNAVDHAIEPPAERRRLGKPEEGLVRVTCFERSTNQLELCIIDDGRGIDREAVARKASRPVPADDAGLLDLITQPGLTTLEQATKTSGRGLGMDIVKRAVVDQLGGEMSLRTTLGAGTTFTLRIPLTITIVDAFSFVCGDQTFVAPVAAIEEIVEVAPEGLVRGPARHTRFGEVRFLERRGEIVPLVNLASVFSLGAGDEPKALLVRRNGAPLAFGIQRMVGQQEVVIRPLEDPLVKVAGVSGSTDLGDGRPTLVLDLVALSGALSQNRTEVAV